MSTFDAAMRFVEEEHEFPPRPDDVHERRLRALLSRSGLDARIAAIPLVIVGGSCGKASTARMLAFILRALGAARVGLGTKPPLRETFDGHRERYQLVAADGAQWISPALFTDIVDELRQHVTCSDVEYAPYDLRMWILLRMFVEMQVEIGIVEANIGLRQDPTAAITSPAAMVLTRVATDHAALLQPPDPVPPSLRAIGDAAGPVWHKAGGLRAGVPSVIGRQEPDVLRAILEIAPPPASIYGRDYEIEEATCSLEGTEARLRLGERRLDLRLSVLGAFQVENAATAAATAALLSELGVLFSDGRAVQKIANGLRAADTPGRMQIIDRDPLTLFNLAAGVPKLRAMMESVLTLTGTRPLVAGLSVIERSADPRECVAEVVAHPQVGAFLATSFLDDGDTRDIAAPQLAAWAREVRPEIEILCVEAGEICEAARRACPPDGAVLLAGDGLGAFLDLHAMGSCR